MEQYSNYLILKEGADVGSGRIAVSFPTRLLSSGDINDYSYNTLEPELFKANGLDDYSQAKTPAFA